MPYVGEFARSVKRVQADYAQCWQQSMVYLKISLIVWTTLLVIASCEWGEWAWREWGGFRAGRLITHRVGGGQWCLWKHHWSFWQPCSWEQVVSEESWGLKRMGWYQGRRIDYAQGWQWSMMSLKTSLIILTTLLVIASCEWGEGVWREWGGFRAGWLITLSFSSCQQNLIKTFQIEAINALITKMVLIFLRNLLNGQK